MAELTREQIEELRAFMHADSFTKESADALCDLALSALDAQGGEAVAWFQREPGVDRRDLIAMVAKEFEGAPGTFPLFARPDTPQKPKYWRWYCEVKEEYLISTEKPVYTHYKNLEALFTTPPPPEAMLKELREALKNLADAYAQLEHMYSEGRSNPINCDEWRDAMALLSAKT